MNKPKLSVKASPKAASSKARRDTTVPQDNIETIARALCERQLLSMSVVAKDAAAGVDRYWPCVAAELEAGLIDSAGNRLAPFDFEASKAAYNDWVQRHA